MRARFRRLATLALLGAVIAGCANNDATSAPAPVPSTPGSTADATAPAATPTGSTSPAVTASPSPLPYPLPSVSVSLQKVVSGLPQPIGIVSTHAPGDARLFVIGQKGQIVIVDGGKVVGTFLDIADRISCCGERGLLGLAFDPDYASNGRLYVRYTDPTGDVVIAGFSRSGSDANRADAASGHVILTIPHREFANHNGGTIAFGPDGYLYVGTGDGGGAGDPHGNGQNIGSLLGKLLRIDVGGGGGTRAPYAVPEGNPFSGRSDARPEIWSYGLRNPYQFSFDRITGDLWIGDVGQNAWEEVDRATVAGGEGRGVNFGWNVLEATHCYNPSSNCDTSGKTPPLAEYDHSAGSCAIVGGFVYRGSARPDLVGRYFFGDYCSGLIWDLNASGPSSQAPQLVLKSGLQITGWGEGPDGEQYLASPDGAIYRLA